MPTSFDFDYTMPTVAYRYPKGKHATRRQRRAYCLWVLLGGLSLALLGSFLPRPEPVDAYVLETPEPKHVRL